VLTLSSCSCSYSYCHAACNCMMGSMKERITELAHASSEQSQTTVVHAAGALIDVLATVARTCLIISVCSAHPIRCK
jgi:hypothetical protein